MRVLLIESEPEDVLFLKDVLTEIAEGRYGSDWVNLEILDVAAWTATPEALSQMDIVLLNLRDGGTEAFRRIQLAAPAIPIVLLVDDSEQSLGVQLVREGAQDFLVKKHVDCAPLAHAMRNAMERHRVRDALRASSTHDTLTGLLNRAGFLTSAERDRKLAAKLNRRLLVMVAEIADGYSDQQKDLVLVDAAHHLRNLAGPADLLAHIESARFAMTSFDEDTWPRIHKALLVHGLKAGAAVFSNDRPATLETLLDQAGAGLSPKTRAAGTTGS